MRSKAATRQYKQNKLYETIPKVSAIGSSHYTISSPVLDNSSENVRYRGIVSQISRRRTLVTEKLN